MSYQIQKINIPTTSPVPYFHPCMNSGKFELPPIEPDPEDEYLLIFQYDKTNEYGEPRHVIIKGHFARTFSTYEEAMTFDYMQP